MPRTYLPRVDEDDESKWAVWYRLRENVWTRAIPGVRFDTEHRAQLVADALNDAFAAGLMDSAIETTGRDSP